MSGDINGNETTNRNEETSGGLINALNGYTVFSLSQEGNIQSWNLEASLLTGYREEEILGKNISIFYPKEDIEQDFPQFELNQAKKSGRYYDEGVRIRKDGIHFKTRYFITCLYNEKKELTGFSFGAQDISDLSGEGWMQSNNEDKFKLLIKGIQDFAIFMLSPEGYILSWNEGAKRLKGYEENEILGKHFSVFYSDELIAQQYPVFELEIAKKAGRFETEGFRLKKDGSEFFAHIVITALYDNSKKLVGYSKITRDLTLKKKSELELRKSEEKYRLLVEGVKDYAIFMLTPKGYIDSLNEGAKKLKGYTESEILGKHFSIFYPEDAKSKNFPDFELEQAIKKGRFEDEGLRLKKDGTFFYANVVITALYNRDNQLIGFSKITRDLTEKKESEELLRKSEEKYRLLIEGVTDYAIFMLDPNGIVISWNEGAKKLKRYEEWEIIGKHFSVFYTKELRDKKFPEFELEHAKKVGRFEDQGDRVRKDGTLFYCNVVITAIRDADNNLLGFSKITRDLTEKRQAEELLKTSEEKYKLLVEGVKDYAIFMLSPKGYITTWNEGAKRLKFYENWEITGKHFSIFYPEEKKKMKYPEFELKEAIKHGKFEDEGLRVRKDGSTFYANVIITAIYLKDELIGFSKITRDLTERKLAEEKLTNMNQELEIKVKERTGELSKTVKELKAINADMDNFIYTASHDLKAPVSNIEGLMNSLHEELTENNFLSAEIESLFEMMQKSVLKFQGTIKDLAAVNETQRAGAEDLGEIDLEELFNDVKESIVHMIKESGASITLTKEINAIRFSKIHMRSIIYNFLTNAIKYRSPERQLKVSFRFYHQGIYNILEVSDNGLGIRQENQDKVFKLFQRIHTHVEGSGIGLYIVNKIVENVGGHVEIDSKVDSGTTFKVFLPDKKLTY